jgi:hypothetical protein
MSSSEEGNWGDYADEDSDQSKNSGSGSNDGESQNQAENMFYEAEGEFGVLATKFD